MIKKVKKIKYLLGLSTLLLLFIFPRPVSAEIMMRQPVPNVGDYEHYQYITNYNKEHGGGFYLNSRVTKIIDDGTKVSGLQVRNSAGEFTISAKAVVIATGGASYEKDDLLNKVTPSVAKVHVFNEASPANTGDGYSLLKAVNAEFSNNDVYKNGTIDFAPQYLSLGILYLIIQKQC